MELDEVQKSHIEEAMSEIECPKAFACYKSRLVSLGSIQGIGANGFLECLEADSQNCPFSLPFEDPAACLCPVRISITHEFAK